MINNLYIVECSKIWILVDKLSKPSVLFTYKVNKSLSQ